MNYVAVPASSHDLHRFELSDMIELGAALRRLQSATGSMEETALAIVQLLYQHLADAQTGEKNCILVRFFKTHRFSDLTPELQAFAQNAIQNKV